MVKLYRQQKHVSQRQVVDRFHRELAAWGTVGEATGGATGGVCRCLGFGFTADLWPYLVLESGGAPLAMVRRTTRVPAAPLALQAP